MTREVLVCLLVLALAPAGLVEAAGGCPPGTDADADGFCAAADNCPSWPNPDQADSNGDGSGDTCQCGDGGGDGDFDIADVALIRRAIESADPGLASLNPNLCDVDRDRACGAADVDELRQALTQPDASSQLVGSCADYAQVIDHVLSRTGFGGDDWTRARIEELGVQGYIDEQLNPSAIDDSAFEALLDQNFETLDLSFRQIQTNYPFTYSVTLPDGSVVFLGKVLPLRELGRAKMLRAALSRRQLETVLTDFWFNHFNVRGPNKVSWWATTSYERDAIRAHVLGNFKDMLLATATSAAMLDYLDNRDNSVDELNENYGRELLELHTIGVGAGYSQADVIGATRAMTGWTLAPVTSPDEFLFKPSKHDDLPKTITNLSLPAGLGFADGTTLLDFLAGQPETALHVCHKLVQRLVSDEPPPALVSAAALTFMTTGGDLREVTRTILTSSEFLDDPKVRLSKVKRPYVLVASLIRATGADGLSVAEFWERRVRELGEGMHEAAPPTGYPEESSAWAGAGGLIRRFNLMRSAANGFEGFPSDYGVISTSHEDIADELIEKLFGAKVSVATRAGAIAYISSFSPTEPNAGIEFLLSSPEFQMH